MTTSNRMELISVITALTRLREACEVELFTDSQYIVNAINKGWLVSWRRSGWKRKGGEVKNLDLWLKLAPLLDTHEITFTWVRGHADNKYNNRCDRIAVAESRKFKTEDQ